MIVTVKPHWTVRRVSDRVQVPADFADTDKFTVTNGLPGTFQRTRQLNFYLELSPTAPQELRDKYPHLVVQPTGA